MSESKRARETRVKATREAQRRRAGAAMAGMFEDLAAQVARLMMRSPAIAYGLRRIDVEREVDLGGAPRVMRLRVKLPNGYLLSIDVDGPSRHHVLIVDVFDPAYGIIYTPALADLGIDGALSIETTGGRVGPLSDILAGAPTAKLEYVELGSIARVAEALEAVSAAHVEAYLMRARMQAAAFDRDAITARAGWPW